MRRLIYLILGCLTVVGCFDSTPPGDPGCEARGDCACENIAPGANGYRLTDPSLCSPEAIACDADRYWADECGCGCGDAPPSKCEAQDIRGEGPCRAILGAAFDGTSCEEISGCSCAGTDCDDLFASVEGCEAAYAECIPEECPDPNDPRVTYTSMDVNFCQRATIFCENGQGFNDDCGCGCIDTPSSCDPQDAAGIGACRAFFGYAWNGTSCESLGGCECQGADCGNLYGSEAECLAAYRGCAAPPPPPPCAAQDAAGEGACRRILGVRFNGSACETLSGCSCRGSDCDALYPTVEACERENVACLPPPGACEAQDIRGEGPCFAFLGVKFNGAQCVGVGGCSCVGTDCADIYGSEADCEAANRSCLGTCPDPDDPAVEYASTNPEECALIRFACDEGETSFSDACGCGCIASRP
ncbi:MAG: hypothetical protein AAGF12_07115 [Myxococcota bacterium]